MIWVINFFTFSCFLKLFIFYSSLGLCVVTHIHLVISGAFVHPVYLLVPEVGCMAQW